jgi:hypothetical protein
MSEALTQIARRLRRRLLLAIWLGRLARQGAVTLALCATVALVARVSLELETERAALFLLPLLAVPFSAWRGVSARVPSAASATAWLDLHSGASGFLLAEFELGDPRWQAQADSQLERLPELPALRMGALSRPLLPALAFAALALFVPLTRAEPGPSTSLFDRALAGLVDRLDVLNETVELDQVVAEELADRVARLAGDVDAAEPEAMLEALDSLREQLDRQGGDAASLAQELSERFGEVGAKALQDEDVAKKLMDQALSQLLAGGFKSDLVQQLQQLSPELAAQLAGNRLQLPEGFQLSPEQLRALSGGLRNAMQDKLGALSLAGLVNLSELKLSGRATARAQRRASHVCDEDCKKPGGT